MLKTRVKTQI